MAEELKIGVLGLTHDHAWGNLAELEASDLGRLVAAADPNAELQDKVRADTSCERVYDEPEEMLSDEALDAVYVFGDNLNGAANAAMALATDLPVLVEKPMASTVALADVMLQGSRESDRALMINWPFAWWPSMQQALAMAEAGDIGRVFSTRYRSAHNGPRALGCSEYFCEWLYDSELNGAGALMDYCCYGAALAAAVLGRPSTVTGVSNRLVHDFSPQEDNAILILNYADAMSVTEASWSQIGHVTSYVGVLYGTEGTLQITSDRLLLATEEHDMGVEVDPSPVPEHWSSATACFLNHLVNGTDIIPLCTDTVGRNAQEILQAGLESCHSGKAVSLPLPFLNPYV